MPVPTSGPPWKLLGAGFLVAFAISWSLPYLDVALGQVRQKAGGKKTVRDRLDEHGVVVDERLTPFFAANNIAYPPARIALVAFKDQRTLHLYAAEGPDAWQWIRSYRIKAASGRPGPKLKEGDYQVPEGLYRIELLNPNSKFHLSLRVNYPNAFDQARAREEGRTGLGGDIMIHGKAVSAGCLAMGDRAVEDLFVLAARTGLDNIDVIIAPYDLRRENTGTSRPRLPRNPPSWYPNLLEDIRSKLLSFPFPKES